MVEKESPRSDFFVGDGTERSAEIDLELMDYREPEPARLPLGTVFSEDGRKRVVAALNQEGHAVAYILSKTRRGKLSLDPRSGGTPDIHDIQDMEKRTMKRKDVLSAFKRGNRRKVKDGAYKKKFRRSLVTYIENQWKPQSTLKRKKK